MYCTEEQREKKYFKNLFFSSENFANRTVVNSCSMHQFFPVTWSAFRRRSRSQGAKLMRIRILNIVSILFVVIYETGTVRR
jgi:hypothetical protein